MVASNLETAILCTDETYRAPCDGDRAGTGGGHAAVAGTTRADRTCGRPDRSGCAGRAGCADCAGAGPQPDPGGAADCAPGRTDPGAQAAGPERAHSGRLCDRDPTRPGAAHPGR